MQKEWITIPVSMLALLISAGTAYLNLIRQTDDVSFILTTWPSIQVTRESIILPSSFSMSFINSGNRAAVIHEMKVMLDQVTEEGSRFAGTCPSGEPINNDFEGMILKEKEILSKVVTLANPRRETTAANALSEKQRVPVELCFNFLVSTPTIALKRRVVPVLRADMPIVSKETTQPHPLEQYGLDLGIEFRPYPVIQRYGTIFD